jgi:hypothetical protein
LSAAETLRRRLDSALEQEVIHHEAFEVFCQQQQDRIPMWKQMVHEYEDDPTKKNPYETEVNGMRS